MLQEHLDKTGRNEFSLNLTVWQNLTHRYALYTDISGFIQNDVAMLAVTANVPNLACSENYFGALHISPDLLKQSLSLVSSSVRIADTLPSYASCNTFVFST